MLRRVLVLLGVVALLISASLASAVTYSLTDLGNVNGSGSARGVARVNGTVTVVGSLQPDPAQFYYDGFYWTAATGIVDLNSTLLTLSGTPNGGSSPSSTTLGSSATGINASGQIVGNYGVNSGNGSGGTGGGSVHAGGFVYSVGSGTAIDAKLPSGGNDFYGLGGINSSGQIGASYQVGISPTSWSARAYADGTTAATGLGSGTNGISSYCINDNGDVAGYGVMNLAVNSFLVNKGGTWYDLGVLTTRTSQLRGIDNNADVVGQSPNSSNKKHPVVVPNTGGATWGSFVDLFTAGSNPSGAFVSGEANAISADGSTIVGDQYVSTIPGTATAFIWTSKTAGSGTDLNTLVPGRGSWYLQQAIGVDSYGDIVGVMSNGSATHAFLLTLPTATPEPSTLVLAFAGLMGLVAYAWRKRK